MEKDTWHVQVMLLAKKYGRKYYYKRKDGCNEGLGSN